MVGEKEGRAEVVNERMVCWVEGKEGGGGEGMSGGWGEGRECRGSDGRKDGWGEGREGRGVDGRRVDGEKEGRAEVVTEGGWMGRRKGGQRW